MGLNKDASDAEIKKSFRKLARKYHPDVNPDDKGSEEKFKEINEAYEVLSDPEKRQKYNMLGADWQRWQQRGDGGGGFNWGQWTSNPGGSSGGGSRRYRTESFEDLFNTGGGTTDPSVSDFFSQIFGRGTGRRRSGFRPRSQPSRDYTQEIAISLRDAYLGTMRILVKNGKRLKATIPPGAKTGTKIRLAGEGSAAGFGRRAGDLFLAITVLPDPNFERKGDDLYSSVEVTMYTALLGGKIRVETMESQVVLTIKPCTQNGQLIRLRGKGMPNLRNKEQYGDLYIKVSVQLPTELTPRQRQLLEEMREMGE